MKRNAFLIALCAMSALTAWANPVSKKAAQQIAQQFMLRQLNSLKIRRAPRMVAVNPVDDGQTLQNLYLFNASDGQGFVIVSGDDRTEPILGYSTTGSIDADQMPDNMRSWLQHYSDQIAAIQEYGLSLPLRTMKDCGEAIAPQLTSKWYQFPIYNAQLPMVTMYADAACTQLYEYPDGRGNMITAPLRAVTGCTITALAQVLYCHRYPLATTADIPGYEDHVNPQTLSTGMTIWNKYSDATIPAGTPIDWDNMADAYDICADEEGNLVSVTTTEVQNNAVASLMHICAAAMGTEFGTIQGIGSSATDADVLRGAINYLGLPHATACLRGFHDYQEWTQLLYDEVKAARCALFIGSSSATGHSFIVDGYDGEDLFHINWGWSGRQDGYFRINALNPGTHDYNKSQIFIRGLYPGAPARENQLYASTFQPEETTLTSCQGTFTIPVREMLIANEQHLQLNAQIGITIEGEGITETQPVDQEFQSIPLKGRFVREHFSFSEKLADGDYLCYPSFRTSETGEWKPCQGKENCCLKLSVSGTTMTVGNVKHLELSLLSSHPATYEAGKNIEFTPTLKVEKGRINESFVFMCMTREDDDTPSSNTIIPLRSLFENYDEGDTFEVPLFLPSLPAGKYTIAIFLSHRQILTQIYNFDIVEVPSSISSLQPSPSSADGGYYDLQGRRRSVSSVLPKGIYISGGRKVVVK